jgi:deoxyribodipyrimidine photo-lyase
MSKISSPAPAICWFRDELRLGDNRALEAAIAHGGPVIALYVHDEASPGLRALGGAARWWLHHSLAALATSLERAGAALTIVHGAAEAVVPAFAQACGARLVTWSRRYGQPERDIDARIKTALTGGGIAAESFCDRLLAEPWTLKTQSGTPFRVFTPFFRALSALGDPPPPLPAPARIAGLPAAKIPATHRVRLEDLGLLPAIPWDAGMAQAWTPGEAGAHACFETFLADGLAGYASGRDRPDLKNVSRLSPHLRFGEISPRQIWHRLSAPDAPATPKDRAKFLAEVGWREFSYHLLFHNPDLATRNFAPRFDGFPWADAPEALAAWQSGRTGVPIIDAGMRELWHTGYMHNRVRMIVASYLVKHLLIDWRRGEAWFWDTLCDADVANNPASWQWVAGSGADAAPYFRVFNPVLQALKFDPDGRYVRRWVPEIATLPVPHLFKPWDTPEAVLKTAGVRLGQTYPQPLVGLDQGRARALAAFAELSKP